ncbi:MAG: T9SS type A sorting domain-containing protein [bacterium]
MAQITGEEKYNTQATLLAKAIKRILYLDDETYQWSNTYLFYPDANKAEDISHALGVLSYVYEYCDLQSSMNLEEVFYKRDLDRFTNMMMKNVYLGDISYYKYKYITEEDDSEDLNIEIPDEEKILTDRILDSVLVLPDGEYDVNSLVDGKSNIVDYRFLYQTNWCRATVAYWANYQKYDPRIMEMAYNITGNHAAPEIALSYLLSNYDDYRPAKIELSKPNIAYSTDDYLEITVDSIKMLGIFKYAVYQENGDTFTTGGIAGKDVEDHIIQVNDLRTKSAEDIVFKYWSDNNGILGPSKEVVIPVVGDTLYVGHRDEIPVLKYEDIEIKVTDRKISEPLPDGYPYTVIEGCTIDVYYCDGRMDKGLTNSFGTVIWNDKYIQGTQPLMIVAYKDGYFPDTSYIEPYMWSTTQDAMGPSSSNHIVMYYDTLKDTTMVNMVYNDGERIISCTSEDFGETWITVSMGSGLNPSITSVANIGSALIWKYGAGWAYSYRTSPWTPIDTNYFDVINSVMPSIITEPGSDTMIWLAGLCESQLYNGNYDIVYSQFKYYRWDTFSQTVLINSTGELNEENYLAIPQANPSIGAKDWSGIYAPMFAFEDKNGEIIKKELDPKTNLWNSITNQSNTSTKSCNPYVNPKSYTDNLKIVWQEEVALNSYRIYLDGVRFAYDNTETDKRYPKIKDKILTYIENGNKMVVCPKLIKSTYANIEINASDSIFNPEIAMYVTSNSALTKIYVRSVYTVKKDDYYRIETSYDRVVSEDMASALIGNEITLSIPTVITTTSYLKDYLPSGDKQKVERISGTYNGLNRYKDYMVEIKTTNNNKNQPYVVVVDGELETVIYGKENTTQIRIDRNDYSEDRGIEIYLDRVIGSPNRTVEMKVYEFDKIESEVSNAGAKKIKLFNPSEEGKDIDCGIKVDKINGKQIVFKIMTDRDDELTVKLIDITGREVNMPIKKQVKRGENTIRIETERMSSGIYFYTVEVGGMRQTGKVMVIK